MNLNVNKTVLLSLVMGFLAFTTSAQQGDWVEQMMDPNVNFYTVQQSFNDYWKDRPYEKGKGYKQFKRWEAFMEPRVYPSGERPNPSVIVSAFQSVQSAAAANLGQWQPKGPYNGNALNGVGRVNRIAFDPNNSNIIWAATPAGGLWKSTDAGQTWSTNTDFLTNLGISDIAIDPTNPNIMYIATGDRDGGDTYSYGILKTTDGGQTWNPTGLSFLVTLQTRISSIVINPSNTNILVTTTRQGIYRSVDGGATWSVTRNGSYNALVQKPGNPNTLYATTQPSGSQDILRSTDGGLTWSILTSPNLPQSGTVRAELAVTPDDSNYIYALYGETGTNGFEGIYRSTDGGNTWTLRANSPNLLGWRSDGSDAGGQAWYDLAIAVNPTDKDEVYVGGVNIWRSTNGGSNWNLAAHWTGSGAPFVHADIHHLTFRPNGNSVYTGCDGGVYRTDNGSNSWDELNDGMNITQFYRISVAASDTTLLVGGSQDNGTDMRDGGTWSGILGGDGMDNAINPQDPNIIYASSQYGNFRKSVNRGQNFFTTTNNFNLPPRGTGGWVTPFLIDPQHPDTLYAGYNELWRSFDAGNTFTAMSATLAGTRDLDRLAIAPNHTNYIMASERDDLWISSNRGSSFSNISSNVPSNREISHMAFAYDNPDHIYITRSSYDPNSKVYESFNGGQTWSNLSSGLPNIPINCIAVEDNPEHSIYIGTDLGVYYRDDFSNGWVRFNSGMPNVIVNDLEINYLNNTISAGTYGRGVYVSPLYGDLNPPQARIDVDHNICLGDTVTIRNGSSNNPDSFKWVISPNTFTYVNSTADTSENPQVIFTQNGFYDIRLSVSNVLGADSTEVIGAVAVGGYPLPLVENFEDPNSYAKWQFLTPDNKGWSVETIGGTTPGSNAARADLFNNNNLGVEYDLISPSMNFTGHDSVWLSFDYAYRASPTSQDDSLKVLVATGCSDNWVQLAAYGENGTQNFTTGPNVFGTFTPSATGDWCGNPSFGVCPVIDLTPYVGMMGVRIRIVAKNAGDNHIYVDNINIEGNPNALPIADFGSPQNVCELRPIQFSDQSIGSPNSFEWTFNGGTPSSSTAKNPVVTYSNTGTFDVKLKITNALGSDSITKVSHINVASSSLVNVSLMSQSLPICSNDTLFVSAQAVNEGLSPIYTWYVNNTIVGVNASGNFDFAGLSNGDIVYCTLESSLACAFPVVATSDTIIANLFPTTNVQLVSVGNLCENNSAVTLSATPVGGTFSGNGVSGTSFDPAMAGVGSHKIDYSYTDVNLCTFTVSQVITVDPVPNVIFDTVSKICLGDPVVLTTGSPQGGTYSGPGVFGNTFYSDSVGVGTHTLTYSYANASCTQVSVTADFEVINGPPVPMITYSNGILTCNQSGFLYRWLLNGASVLGAKQQSYTPSSFGLYTVEITDPNGCSRTSLEFDYFQGIGIEELSNQTSLELYPNPAEGFIMFKLDAPVARDLEYSITNNLGSLVKQVQLPKSAQIEEQINLEGLPSGMYIITIEGEGLNMNRKFILK